MKVCGWRCRQRKWYVSVMTRKNIFGCIETDTVEDTVASPQHDEGLLHDQQNDLRGTV